MIINGNQTQIHWYTKQKQISAVILEDKTYQDDAKTNFHNILVKEQKFQFKVNAISDLSFNYFLPETIQKFVVLSDVHNNGSYLEQMDSNYDFSLLCGDYSYGGKAHEFAKAFRGMHMKPVIMAVGNHDALGDVNELVRRETNFYQKIGQNGLFFLYVLNQNILHHCHLNKARVDNAIKFLSDNMQLSENDENVFIVSHQAIYSTGEFGSIEYFTKKMEDFIDSHPTSKIRAIFSGHDHVFSSFKKNNVFYFVNGSGGGPLDSVFEWGDRAWNSEEMSGPLPVLNANDMGYDYHLKSYQKYTRTEVSFEAQRIIYTIRDLCNNQMLDSFEQILE
ncbi:Alkaline_phosphatase [Hexamita inflata]|uniref:Alkaline phosphatase n=1 Tax=Hexamita inflata TaxID=28002 RepID=A0AA86P8F5_9EUKA|nr:Alkaline phosphatase [Hexamita inflata]